MLIYLQSLNEAAQRLNLHDGRGQQNRFDYKPTTQARQLQKMYC
jgi:hypothetical protein